MFVTAGLPCLHLTTVCSYRGVLTCIRKQTQHRGKAHSFECQNSVLGRKIMHNKCKLSVD